MSRLWPRWYVSWRSRRARRRLIADYRAQLAALPAGSQAIVEAHDAALDEAFLLGRRDKPEGVRE